MTKALSSQLLQIRAHAARLRARLDKRRQVPALDQQVLELPQLIHLIVLRHNRHRTACVARNVRLVPLARLARKVNRIRQAVNRRLELRALIGQAVEHRVQPREHETRTAAP